MLTFYSQVQVQPHKAVSMAVDPYTLPLRGHWWVMNQFNNLFKNYAGTFLLIMAYILVELIV